MNVTYGLTWFDVGNAPIAVWANLGIKQFSQDKIMKSCGLRRCTRKQSEWITSNVQDTSKTKKNVHLCQLGVRLCEGSLAWGWLGNLLEEREFPVCQAHLIHESGHFTVDHNSPWNVCPGFPLMDAVIAAPPSRFMGGCQLSSVQLVGGAVCSRMLVQSLREFHVRPAVLLVVSRLDNFVVFVHVDWRKFGRRRPESHIRTLWDVLNELVSVLGIRLQNLLTDRILITQVS